jgi:nucleoside 2-deoxyribosyltransferase
MARSIYLAGPDVFLADAVEVGERKRELCKRFGFEGLFPLDKDKSISGDAAKIFRANCERMRRADIGLFNLTPFRGPSADSGTVFELGFMVSLGKPVYGYSSATVDYAKRVAAFDGPLEDRQGQLWDRHGYAVENFGLSDNLMIERAIRDAGGMITRVAEQAGEPLAAFQAFESCLASVARAHSEGAPDRSGTQATL